MRNRWISKQFLAPDAVELGRLVLNAEYPEQDFYRPEPVAEDCITLVRLESFQDSLARSEGSRFHAFLTRLLSVSFGIQDDSKTVVQSVICKTYQLKNSGAYFRNICKADETREWLEEVMQSGNDVYLVVGIKTLTDARITQSQQRSKTGRGGVEIPLGQLTAAVTTVVGHGGFGVGGSRTSDIEKTAAFVVPGEQVYAVQYRRVQFAWYSRRDIDKASLENGNRWKVYVSGGRGGYDGYDNIFDVELEDSPDKSGLENDCESVMLGDEEVLFIDE
ncbi:hypothetical protein K440DRAFT_658308 [Wilcoxina mikolae CBS 423.85]|nr:hypothetical protein K440DRAFT_658308 [Wilcoxina mikolae CBS 423.85]